MNRREYLVAGAGVTATGLTGCLSALWQDDRIDDAHVWLQRIYVYRDDGTQRHKRSLLNVQYADGNVTGEIAAHLSTLGEAVTDIQVDDSLADDLDEEFDDVAYLVGFCWDDDAEQECRNLYVSRDVFNRAQFGDRLDVRLSDSDAAIRTVYEGELAVESAQVTTFEFEERRGDAV